MRWKFLQNFPITRNFHRCLWMLSMSSPPGKKKKLLELFFLLLPLIRCQFILVFAVDCMLLAFLIMFSVWIQGEMARTQQHHKERGRRERKLIKFTPSLKFVFRLLQRFDIDTLGSWRRCLCKHIDFGWNDNIEKFKFSSTHLFSLWRNILTTF